MAASLATRSRHETTPATTVASLAIGPRSVDSHDAARPTSHRWRRIQLCSCTRKYRVISSGIGHNGSPPL
jgi:hypothetical protein